MKPLSQDYITTIPEWLKPFIMRITVISLIFFLGCVVLIVLHCTVLYVYY